MNASMMIFFAVILVVAVALLLLVSKNNQKLDYRKQWRDVVKTFNEGSAGQKLAVSNADKLLDSALQSLGFKGETMGERMKSARTSLGRHNNAAWSAHKLRNRLAHEADFKPSKRQCSQALSSFKKTLSHLGVKI